MFGFRLSPPHPDTVDLSTRRSIEIRSRTGDAFTVDYFYHEGEYWTALIPLAVEKVAGQSFNFSRMQTRRGKSGPEIVYDKEGYPRPRFSFVNHLQTRFKVSDAGSILLYKLFSDPDSNTPVQHRLNDFVYSVEATGPPGTEFDFKNGLAGTLLCMHRFLSTQEMVFERVVIQGQYVWESPPLSLSAKEMQVVLMKSLERSHRAGVSEVYYLYRLCRTNNCTSNPFQIVDESVKYTLMQRLGSFAYRFPVSPRLYLRVRGLDSDPSFRKLVRTDFEEFITNADTQKRKRNVVRKLIQQRRAMQGRQKKAR